MVKYKAVTHEEAKELLASAHTRQRGDWQELIDKVKKTKQPLVVEDVTRGQAWALRRTAINAGIKATVLNGGNKVLLTP